MTGREGVLDLDRDGACLAAGLATDIISELDALMSRERQGLAGVRLAGKPELAKLLGQSMAVGARARSLLGPDSRPVRAVLFDKSDTGNWALGWHQDRTIAVKARADTAGFGPWSVKQGIQHVEPPFAVIESMVTVRIHLDPVDPQNAPLLIARGSHLHGRIPVDKVEEVVAAADVQACLAASGDVWLYRTPILHASARAAVPGRRRRVLQVDYAARDLPAGLEWLGI
jgi:hypothetical protein